MGKKSLLFAALLAMLGVCLILWPVLHGSRLQFQATDAAQSFLAQQAEAPQYPELLAALQEYNRQLYAEKQSGLTSLEACQVPAADLTAYGIADEVFGVLEIPAMDLTMPIYLGASDEHLAAGAAVLGQTSVPIGGDSTNAVIAGHRGWKGADYFRHIDRLDCEDDTIGCADQRPVIRCDKNALRRELVASLRMLSADADGSRGQRMAAKNALKNRRAHIACADKTQFHCCSSLL